MDMATRSSNADRGGVGAHFIGERQAAQEVVRPIVEAIMTEGLGAQGLSLASGQGQWRAP
jgi:hypothetical protein